MLGMSKRLRPSSGNWEALRDLKVKKARIEADVELRRLETDQVRHAERKAAAEAEIASTGETEASLRAREVRGRRWGVLFVLAAGIAIASAWWSADWFLSLGWEKALLAVTIFVLPLIGWMTLLTFSKEILQTLDLRKIFAGMGLVIVLSSAAAVAALGWGRMLGVGLQEEQRQMQQVEIDQGLANGASAARRARIESAKRVLNGVAGLAVIFLAIAGEVAAGIAYHEWAKHRDIVGTVRPFFRRRDALADALATNEATQEAVRRRPEILEAALTVEGLEAEAAGERRAQSFLPTVRWIVGGFVALLALLAAAMAFAEPAKPGVSVVVLDLSTSVTPAEFSENARAIEGLIRRLPAGGAEIRILAVDEASFGRGPLFSARSPQDAGRFGEYLDDWRSRTLRAWEKRVAGLTPAARGSDVIGAIARAALELEEAPEARKRLVILSDMRQVGRGLNFEKAIADPAPLVERVKREQTVPALAGVEVWVLGAETRGIDEGHWRRLRSFWTEYFKAAGAELKAFSPNRRLTER
ncbi:MAG: vWA domain-containing protein [Vicinamibacteria bacterium]